MIILRGHTDVRLRLTLRAVWQTPGIIPTTPSRYITELPTYQGHSDDLERSQSHRC